MYLAPDSTLTAAEIAAIATTEPSQVLRDHHRSLVTRIITDKGDFVIKQPRNKNASYWIRFTTLYRDSEVVLDLKSQLLLHSLGLESTTPVAAMEKRNAGMVIDSRIIYRYREGTGVTEQYFPEVIGFINTLNDYGYVHDDPHTKNFLHHQNSVFAIDCKPRKNHCGKLGRAYNLVLLAKRQQHPQLIENLIKPSTTSSASYRLMEKYFAVQQWRRGLKNKLRELLSLAR